MATPSEINENNEPPDSSREDIWKYLHSLDQDIIMSNINDKDQHDIEDLDYLVK